MKRSLALATLCGALATVALALLVVVPVAITHREAIEGERGYGSAIVSLVVKLRAGSAENPRASDPLALVAGRNAYTGSCAICHGAKGDGRGTFGNSTFPDAADLTSDVVRSRTDAELFWLTKNGLSFTAMPSFGAVYKDDDLWDLVVYIRALQRGTSSALPVPEPTAADRAVADPFGDAAARGAAVYFAQGCHLCHGPEANGPGDLDIHGRIGTDVVRKGQNGMPSFGPDRISAPELADLEAFLIRYAADPRPVQPN